MAGRSSILWRLRLLPVLVVAAALVLTVRVGDLWHGISVMAQEKPAKAPLPPGTRWIVEPAQGKDPTAQNSAAAGQGAAASGAPAAAGNSASQGSMPKKDSAQMASTEVAGASGDAFQMPADPLTMTDEEVSLLQSLAERRQELDRRASQVEEREALLQAAEKRVAEQVDGLKALQKTIEDLLKQHEKQTEAQYNSLVKIYESMKPKDAARIFEQLDMDVLLPVVERMKERKSAPILAKMNPEKAKKITTELAQRRQLPTADAAAPPN
jgi:flagellar motility protein MotE (MotC chaperone)